MDDKLSEEMKTEKDFIEKIETNTDDINHNKFVISTKNQPFNNEREQMKREMDIMNRESVKPSNEESEVGKHKTDIESLKATPVVHEEVENEKVSVEETKMEEVKDVPTPSTPVIETEVKPEVQNKNIEKKESLKVKKEKEVSVVSAKEAEIIKDDEENKPKLGTDVIIDDMDQRVRNENIEIRKVNEARLGEFDDDFDDLTPAKVLETIDSNYEDSSLDADDNDNIPKQVEVIDYSESSEEKKIIDVAVNKASEEPRERNYYGGDGEQSAFKIRTAKIAKVLRNIKLENTDSITATDISKKTQKEQQNIYMSTVLPTLQPRYSVVPFVVSGVVITMTAFQWVDIKEICKIDEKIDDLDPSSDDYIYNKNLIFLEKREKEMDIFYRHIYSVSGYETKPSRHKLFSEIIKFPDFQQLFFAAYTSTFQNPTSIGLTCATCGTTHDLSVKPKDLCFLLNKHIDIDKLNKFINKGAISSSSTAEVYEEFQKEKIVESANSIFRIQDKLPISSFIYELQVPYVSQAYDALAEIIEKFRDKPLEYIDEETQQFVSIDSTFNLPDYMIELRKYIYLKSLMVPHVVEESGETTKVSYISFTDLDGIIDSVYNLSSEDYSHLMRDPRLNSLMNVSGIRHLIDGKQCPEESCGAELGLLPVEPEMLFFMTARQSLNV